MSLTIPEGEPLKRFGLKPPPERTGPIVYLCGLPSSGNRVIERCIKRRGWDTWIIHGVPTPSEIGVDSDTPYGRQTFGRHMRRCAERLMLDVRPGKTYAIMPVRSEFVRQQSLSSDKNREFFAWTADYTTTDMIERVTWAFGRDSVPWRTISYEAFVQSPADELDTVLQQIGLPPGDAEWRSWVNAHVIDGNAKYRNPTHDPEGTPHHA